ncbi:hypothetical protein LCGC14_0944670 [marine sediment metagenome]|uniref:Helix-turn-helix domain-containing protein n=1 Tax=marine sediment metagenome TaxID=412755 RepID=A0A0F9P542_9ZZZZ
MIKRADSILQGSKEICAYIGRREDTLIKWIQQIGFPASKIGGGIWESDKQSIDAWRRKQVELGVHGVYPGVNDDAEKPATSKNPPAIAQARRAGKKKR